MSSRAGCPCSLHYTVDSFLAPLVDTVLALDGDIVSPTDYQHIIDHQIPPVDKPKLNPS